MGLDTAALSITELIEHQKQLKKLLQDVPADGSKAYESLKAQLEAANKGTASLEEELEKLKLQYRENQKAIEGFNKSLETATKEEEKAARAAEIAAQKRIDAEQRKSDKILATLKDQAEKQRIAELSMTQEGLEILRQEELERLRMQKEFALLTDKEQEANIAKINHRYDKEVEKLVTKAAKDNPVAGSTNALRKELIALNKELDNTAHEIDGKVNPRFIELTNQSKALTDEISKAEQASGRFQRNVGNYPDLGASIKETFENIGPDLIAAFSIGSVVDLTIQGLQSVIAVGAEFQKSISNLSAITGAAGDDLIFFTDAAIEMGVESTLGASATAEAFKIVGSASPELLKSKEALVGVTESAITLGQAATIDLPEAAASLTTVLNQFKNGAETAEQAVARAAHTIDVLAAGSQAGAAEVGEIAESMKKFGTTANSLGISLETSVGLIETLGDKAIKSEIAGTGLRGTLVKIAGAGIGMKDGVLDINAALEELAPIQNDVTALTKLFGQENLVVAQTLIQNREQVVRYTEAVNQQGVAAEQARINMDNLAGDQAKFNAAVEGLQLNIFKELSGDTRGLVQTFTQVVEFLSVGIKDGLDDLLSPIKAFYNAIFDVFKVFGNLLSIFGKGSKEGNAFGTVLKVLGGIMTALSLPLRAIVGIIKFFADGFVSVVKGIKDFISNSPGLLKAIEVITWPMRTLGGVLSDIGGFFSDLFGGEVVAKAEVSGRELVKVFGSVENAAAALRAEFGASKEEYDAFVKGFDQKLLVGKSLVEARTIVEQEFKKFLDTARQSRQELANESAQALTAQAQAEEDALLERSVKGLEILRKRRQAELAAEEGFAALGKAQQLLLQEKIDREINEKKKALNQAARKEDFTEALKALRERIEKEKEATLLGTEEGLEAIRKLRIAELEKEKGFSRLKAEEQLALIEGINRDIDAKLDALRKKRSEDTQKSVEDSIAVTIAFINEELSQLTLADEKANLAARQALDQREREALAAAGNNLEARLKIQEQFNLERRDLEQGFQEEQLELQLEAVEKQLRVADLGTEQMLDLERQAQQLRADIYDADRKAQEDAEEAKRTQLEKTLKAQKDIADGIQSAVNSITGIVAASAESQIRSINELDARQQQQADAEIERIGRDFEARKLQLESRITDQNQLTQALEVLEAKRNADIAKIEANAAKEKAINDKALADEQERRQRAVAFQKKMEALQSLVDNAKLIRNNAVILSNNLKAISEGASIPFPANLVAIVTIVASIAAALANVRTLTQSYTKFESGGRVDRQRTGYHTGPSHSRGGKLIEIEGGEFVNDTHSTDMFMPYLSWMNDQGLRRRRGLPYKQSVEAMLSDIEKNTPVPMPTPSFRFQTGGLAQTQAIATDGSIAAIESGLSSGFGEMNALLKVIAAKEGRVVLSLPELGRQQVKLLDQEDKGEWEGA